MELIIELLYKFIFNEFIIELGFLAILIPLFILILISLFLIILCDILKIKKLKYCIPIFWFIVDVYSIYEIITFDFPGGFANFSILVPYMMCIFFVPMAIVTLLICLGQDRNNRKKLIEENNDENKKKQKQLLLYIIVIIIVIIIILTIIFCIDKKIKNSEKTIHYYTNADIYDIKIQRNELLVEKRGKVQCFKEPCEPIKIKSFKTEYTDEYKKIVEKLFFDENMQEIVISDQNLTDEEFKIISSIIQEKNIEGNEILYNILDSEKYNSRYSKRGYYVEKNNNDKVIVTVAMGEKGTSGYTISVDKINIIEGGVEIYVEETYPPKGSNVLTVITYPIIQIEFEKMPEYVKVRSTSDFQDFEKIDIE